MKFSFLPDDVHEKLVITTCKNVQKCNTKRSFLIKLILVSKVQSMKIFHLITVTIFLGEAKLFLSTKYRTVPVETNSVDVKKSWCHH